MSEKACDSLCREIPKAMYARKEQDSIVVNERMRDEVDDNFILKKVAFKGSIQPTDNKRKRTRTKGMQKPTSFDDENYELEECFDDNYESADFKVANDDSNHRDAESSSSNKKRACETEVCDVESARGFRFTDTFDWRKKYDSEILCAEELYEYGYNHVKEESGLVRDEVADFAVFNLKQNLLRNIVLRGEANTSIYSQNMGQNITSKGGFNSAPVSFLTIPHLKSWRSKLLAEGALKKTMGKLVIQGPAQDFILAIAKYESEYLGLQNVVNREPYEDVEGKLKGRQYIEYDMIRYYVNEFPMKAAMIRNGAKTTYRHIYPTVDSTDHVYAGVGDKINPNYYGQWSLIDGQYYENVTFYHFIHDEAMCRWGLLPPTNPHAKVTDSQGQINVITGAHIPCNKDEYKWHYRLENRLRLRVDHPEWMGACIALSRDSGGSIAYLDKPTNTPPMGDKPCPPEVVPEEFAKCGALECEDPCNETECTEKAEINLSPCPIAQFLFEGDALEGAVRIKLESAPCEAGTVDFAFVDDSAVFDTDYTSSLGQTGTIEFEAGCSKDVVIPISVLNVTPDADENIIAKIKASLTLSNATGGVELGDCDSVIICLEDGVCDCPVDGCESVEVSTEDCDHDDAPSTLVIP